ncbi:MAG: SusC/RagA family TonB-linked outer membrane protein [Paludibacteraceae bacterium]|nr:SusC/RagA family TonB-linked outer membrane protein [Paludibacteraceae bacterium]
MKNDIFNLRALLMSCFMLVGLTAFAQTTVQGTVIDAANGEPIIGASILEIGTTNGTITDWDGNFVLNVQPGAKLAISYMGYKTQELDAVPNMKVKLGEDSELLEEVVVVGYGVVKKGDATGSVTAIKPDDMNKGLTTNAQDMIQGKIAGVNVVAADGTPGGAGSITIRGGASLNASNSPLIVIDGLAMDENGIQGVSNPLSMVNPNDIESFTVLKDASATAIYGSRASNGVIIITTKKGAKGSKPKVSYAGNISIGTLTNRTQVLTADQLRGYATALGHNEDKTDKLGTASTDWQDQIYRTTVSTDHNVSIMGGVKNNIVDMPYRASIGYTLQNGAIKTSQMQRVTASLNLSPSFLDNHLAFNINTKGMYIYNRYPAGVVGAALSMDPTMPVKGEAVNANGDVLVAQNVLDQWFDGYYQRVVTPSGYNDDAWPYTTNAQTTGNPAAALAHKNDRANAGSFVGNVEADYKIHGFEDLHIHANFGADYSYGKQKTVTSVYGYDNHYFGWNGWSDMRKYNLQFSAYAQYGHDWEEANQHFDVMVGYENQYFYRRTESDGSGFYQSTNKDAALAGQPYNRYSNIYITDNALQSVYGRVNWNGWDQILVTATFRADASSRFAKYNSKGENARWGLFPSLALGWKIKETFLKDVNSINDLKLRVGYGITGQQNLGVDYYYLPTYTTAQDHAYYPVLDGGESNPLYAGKDANGNAVYYTSRPGVYNTDLTWEKTFTSNIGIDFAFLNNRINGNIDYYHRRTKDLLSTVNVSAGSNFKNQMLGNIGSLYNQGIEFAINAVLVDRKNFKWDLGYNVAWNQNKITQLLSDDPDYFVPTGGISSGTGNTIQAHKVGEAAYSFLVYETKTMTDEDGVTRHYFIDRNKDGQINDNDKYIYHNPAAPVTMGFQTKFQFYGFDLGITLRANIGNYVYNDVLAGNLQWVEADKVYQNQNGGYHSVLTSAFNCYYGDNMRSDDIRTYVWNDETQAYEVGTDAKTGALVKNSNWYASDFFVEKASFLRIDNITLGYSFNKTKVQGRAYVTVSNPCVISSYKGLDPEVGGGIDNNIYPRSMTTVMGVSLQF